MNDRERFNATMHYRPRDRAPICDFGFWEDTLVVWHEQGLPEEIYFTSEQSNHAEFFGMDFGLDSVTRATDITVGLMPPFEEKILEDRGDHYILQQEDGVRVLRRKFMSSIPQPQSHLLTDRQSWRQHYLPRLDPTHPGRFPADWAERVRSWADSNRNEVIALPGGSLYGWLRNWMGVENLSYVVYDDPAWFEEMVTGVADCIIGVLSQALESGAQFDACGMWEDMCYRAGPLLSPRHFKQYLAPHYRRITDLLHKYGVDVIWVDCDGKIDALLPLWLEAGINCMFPIEVGVWGADPIQFRRQYSRELLLMGGFDKHILQGTKDEIEREVHRLTPLVEEGGYIGFCDHRVPPDVPLENYMFYLETVRQVWGRGLNLKPMRKLVKEYGV
jgi:uroporphyrinogen decarboxylase